MTRAQDMLRHEEMGKNRGAQNQGQTVQSLSSWRPGLTARNQDAHGLVLAT